MKKQIRRKYDNSQSKYSCKIFYYVYLYIIAKKIEKIKYVVKNDKYKKKYSIWQDTWKTN